MDKFNQSENKGRQLFKSILDQCQIIDQQPSPDKYDSLDYYYNNNGKKVGVEIKTRDIKYQDYPTHLMELKKYQALQQRIANKELDSVLYANFFGDSVAYIYSLGSITRGIAQGKVQQETKYLNRTTAIYKGKTDKTVLFIDKSLALKLVKVEGQWRSVKQQ